MTEFALVLPICSCCSSCIIAIRRRLQRLRRAHRCSTCRIAEGRRFSQLLQSSGRLRGDRLRRRNESEESGDGLRPHVQLLVDDGSDVTVIATYPYDIHLLNWVVASGQLEHNYEGASRMSFVRKNESGQAIVLMTLSLIVIMGMGALVLDVGNWFHTKRRLQGTADAATLAGAQQLPDDPSGARAMALSYANQNGGDVASANITVTSTVLPNDTISVKAQKTDPGFFSGSWASPARTSTRARRPVSARPHARATSRR